MVAEDALWPWVALRMVPGVRVRLYHKLLNWFREPAVVLAASEEELERAGVPRQTARAMSSSQCHETAKRDVERAAAVGARLVTWADPAYPSLLRYIHDPPPYLYVLGQIDERDGMAVAIVGSRAASTYGRESAETLAYELAAAGMTIVSGLAYGIDGAAHRGALGAGGRTIAVLGCGVDVTYPREHGKLAEKIAASGALVSEFFVGTPPRPAHFPIRNRIISGLSLGVLVVEATERSGSLITARLALDQGREVFAVPGPITAARSRGVHELIRRGAKLVTAAVHVLEELSENLPVTSHSSNATGDPENVSCCSAIGKMGVEARLIIDALEDGPADVDALVLRTGLTPQVVLRILLEMELSGVVEQFAGVGFGLQREQVAWDGDLRRMVT